MNLALVWVVGAWFLCPLAGCQLGCGEAGEGTSRGDEVRGPVMHERAVEFVSPGATEYAGDRGLTPFEVRVQSRLADTPGEHLRLEPCLSLAATEYSRHVAPDRDGVLHLPKELQAAVLQHAGCTDGWVASHLFFSSSSDEDEFFEHLEKVVGKSIDATHLGVGRARASSPYKWAYGIFLAERSAILSPVPRQLKVGQRLRIEGALQGALKAPRVLLLEPGGDVVGVDIEERQGRFEAVVKVGPKTGEHWVELLADGRLGPQVLALFPVYVGSEAPSGVRLKPPPDESMITSERDAELLMLELLNADRRRFGFQPLVWSQELAQIARQHSQDMSQHGFFAHISPTRGDLNDRFTAGNFAARALAENISRNDSVYDSQQGLMLSLGHRENILNASFTHVGIGAVFMNDEYGRRSIFFTQNFARPQRSMTGGKFRKEVLSAVEKVRSTRQLPRMILDTKLQEVAAVHVRLVDPDHGGQPTSKVSEMIKMSLGDRGVRYKTIYIQSHTVLDPADVQLPEAVALAHVNRIGVGVYPVKNDGASKLWKTLILLTQR